MTTDSVAPTPPPTPLRGVAGTSAGAWTSTTRRPDPCSRTCPGGSAVRSAAATLPPRPREPGRGLVIAGMVLLGLLDAGLLYVVYAAQYRVHLLPEARAHGRPGPGPRTGRRHDHFLCARSRAGSVRAWAPRLSGPPSWSVLPRRRSSTGRPPPRQPPVGGCLRGRADPAGADHRPDYLGGPAPRPGHEGRRQPVGQDGAGADSLGAVHAPRRRGCEGHPPRGEGRHPGRRAAAPRPSHPP